MILRFATFEEACVSQGLMRAEGRFAEVLDEGCLFVYGPQAIGGVRLWVSDEVYEDGESEVPRPERRPDGALRDFLRLVAGTLMAAGLLVIVGGFALGILGVTAASLKNYDGEVAEGAFRGLIMWMLPLGLLLAGVPLWPRFCHGLREGWWGWRVLIGAPPLLVLGGGFLASLLMTLLYLLGCDLGM